MPAVIEPITTNLVGVRGAGVDEAHGARTRKVTTARLRARRVEGEKLH